MECVHELFFTKKPRTVEAVFSCAKQQGAVLGGPPVVALATLEARHQGRGFPVYPQTIGALHVPSSRHALVCRLGREWRGDFTIDQSAKTG